MGSLPISAAALLIRWHPTNKRVPSRCHCPSFTVNEAEALFDGDAYQAMLAMLARAERSIRVEFFLFGGPHADAMIDLLVAARERGVVVRVTLDRGTGFAAPGAPRVPGGVRRLQTLGIDVALSDRRPLPGSPHKATGIAHNKSSLWTTGGAWWAA
jgi:phosphatidylserine/phosphatidylglycerophosphate/cardiolipin synthase-like enzyme